MKTRRRKNPAITHLASTYPETERSGPMARNPATAVRASQFSGSTRSGTEEGPNGITTSEGAAPRLRTPDAIPSAKKCAILSPRIWEPGEERWDKKTGGRRRERSSGR